MRKDEYLNTIAQALKQYDTAYVNEIISDYEEHFKDGLSQGKSEEDICAELGDINDIIDEIKDLLGERHLKQFEIARPRAELEKSAGGYQYDEAPREDTDRIRIQFMAGSADVKVFRSPENIVNIYTEDPDDMVYLDCSQRGNTYMGRICPRSSAKFLGTDILLSLLGATVDEGIIEVPYDAASVDQRGCLFRQLFCRNNHCRDHFRRCQNRRNTVQTTDNFHKKRRCRTETYAGRAGGYKDSQRRRTL